jgi:membrane protease YdiL (CAAX protease family)
VLARLAYPFWNRDERRIRAFFRLFLPLLGLIAVSPVFVRQLVLRLSAPISIEPAVRYAFRAARGAEQSNVEAVFAECASYPLWTFLVLVVALWLPCRFVDRRSIDDLGLRIDRSYWIDVAFGALLGGALMTAILGVEIIFGWASYRAAPDATNGIPRFAFVPIGAFAFLAVAIVEELIFRGYQLTNMAEGLRSRWLSAPSAVLSALCFSSTLFGFMHVLNPNATLVSTANIVVAGLMLGIGFVMTGRLAIPLGIHFSWNFFQNLYGMPVSGLDHLFFASLLSRHETGPDWITGGTFGPEGGITGLAAIVAGTLCIFGWLRLRYGSLGVDAAIAMPPMFRVR